MAVITLSQPADSGAILLSGSSDDGAAITTVAPRLVNLVSGPALGNRWWYMYFAMSNCLGETRTIRVAKANYFQISANQQTWYYSEDNGSNWTALTKSDDVTYFYYDKGSAWASSNVLVASGIPRHLDAWGMDFVTLLSGSFNCYNVPGGVNGVWGYTEGTAGHGQLDDLGRTVDPQPIYCIRIGESGTPKDRCVVLTGGNHPGETTSDYGLIRALEVLISETPEGQEARAAADYYVFPNINPEGRKYGYFRSSPETPGEDNNRIWNLTGTNSTIDLIKSKIIEVTAGKEFIGLWDYHYIPTPDAYLYLNTDVPRYAGRQNEFTRRAVAEYGGSIVQTANPPASSAGWLATEVQTFANAKIGLLIEQNQNFTLAQTYTWHEAAINAVIQYSTWAIPSETIFAKRISDFGADYHYRWSSTPRSVIGPTAGFFGTGFIQAPSLVPVDVGIDYSNDFDGVTRFQVLAADALDYNAPGITWLCFIQYPDGPITSTANSKYIIGHGLAPGATGPGFGLSFMSTLYGPYPGFQVFLRDTDNNGVNQEVSFAGYDDGEIHCVAFGWSTNLIRVWVDGIVVYESTATLDPAKVVLTASNLQFAARGDLSAGRFWDGYMDEMMRFPRLLTSSEIETIMIWARSNGLSNRGDFRRNRRPWRIPA